LVHIKIRYYAINADAETETTSISLKRKKHNYYQPSSHKHVLMNLPSPTDDVQNNQ